ncbi:bacteriophage abortive infection AbiH family protein [Bacillus altitudinis]|uniref:bacteriophage abortive infection AbiH family protein n=1 Tax=Bacillus altitudinis TaxID=293387 RepID=UPI002DBC0754|nr:bacteriophage abortive infection AbiH family protein [Bacillus altitudinis]MEC2037519.1 bacteriophage abortive infection AbiH family protein [Bacillus altitudinis]
MSGLFVIGNGFDISHGLKTSYDDFRKYLISDIKIETDYLIEPESRMDQDGGILYDEVEVLSMLFYLISEAESNTEKWSNVEASLANLDFSQVFDYYDEVLDKDGDIDFWKTSYNNEDIASNLVIPTLTIQQLFSEWINTIVISEVKTKVDFIELIKNEDLFLTFNYTETLEEVYEVSNEQVCYIHGKQNEEIYFGHGYTDDKTDYYLAKHIGSENSISEIYESLRKKTELALEDKMYFFDSLSKSNIKEIYSYGFSFSEVDMLYMKEICKRLDTRKVVWYFNDFDQHSHNDYKNNLVECGFKGNFSTFNISNKESVS